MQGCLKECWCSAQRGRPLISAAIIISEMMRQTGLQECCDSSGSWCTSISVAMISKMLVQRGFELRGVVKPLVFFRRHLARLVIGGN
jgi:hypothetical protein